MKYTLILALMLSSCVDSDFNSDVCVDGKLYLKRGDILYPKYGFSEQLTCLLAKD